MRPSITPEEMRALEARATQKGTLPDAMMDEAGKQIGEIAIEFVLHHKLAQKALVLAGSGNNGGDAYVVARTLLQHGFSVTVWQLLPLNPTSLTRKQRRRFEARGGKVIDITDEPLPLPQEGIIVDGIFGTGFHGTPDSKISSLIERVNASLIPIIAIDLPSGIDAATGKVAGAAIRATVTATVEYAKAGFFLEMAYNYIGELRYCPIGLNSFLDMSSICFSSVEETDIRPLFPTIVRCRHKYEAGFVVGLAGSHGMAGAALLSSFAALKAGAGIVHLMHPETNSAEFAGVPLEVVRVPYANEKPVAIVQRLQRASACFIGPGLGSQTAVLDAVFSACRDKKAVIDADALTWLATKYPKGKGLGPLPQAILTPHLGELARLFGLEAKTHVTLDLVERCQEFVDTNQTYLVLKGAPTFLFAPQHVPELVLSGDPGMATAGSGDVLTGVLAALLAQGLLPQEAMRLGVFLHGLAGQLAAEEETSYCITASSIISYLPHAYKRLMHSP